jgi:hypothetical protein
VRFAAAVADRGDHRVALLTVAGARFRELREGWDAFRSRSWLWGIVVQFAFVNAATVGVWSVLGPIVAENELGGAAAWGFIVAAQAAGFVFGSAVTLRYRPSRMLLVATLAIFPTALPILLLASPAPLVVIAAAAFVSGVGVELFGVLWDVTMQQEISSEQLSRVYSYDALGSFVVITAFFRSGATQGEAAA